MDTETAACNAFSDICREFGLKLPLARWADDIWNRSWDARSTGLPSGGSSMSCWPNACKRQMENPRSDQQRMV